MSYYLSTEAMTKRVEAAVPEFARRVTDGLTDLASLPPILANQVIRYLQTGRVDAAGLIF